MKTSQDPSFILPTPPRSIGPIAWLLRTSWRVTVVIGAIWVLAGSAVLAYMALAKVLNWIWS